jgi:serine/threonine protein kinase
MPGPPTATGAKGSVVHPITAQTIHQPLEEPLYLPVGQEATSTAIQVEDTQNPDHNSLSDDKDANLGALRRSLQEVLPHALFQSLPEPRSGQSSCHTVSSPPAEPPTHTSTPRDPPNLPAPPSTRGPSRAPSSPLTPRSPDYIESLSSFSEITTQIRTEIRGNDLYNRQSPDLQFVVAGTAERRLDRRTLTRLFAEELGKEEASKFADVVEKLGLQVIILVLIQINWQAKDLKKFHNYYANPDNQSPPNVPLDLPTAQWILGSDCGQTFFDSQSCYAPVIIQEGSDGVVSSSQRLPIEILKRLGSGAGGAVFEVKIPAGAWKDCYGCLNVDDKIVAMKLYHRSERFEAEKHFEDERNTYRTLGSSQKEFEKQNSIPSDGTWDNITSYLGSLQHNTSHGTEYRIFLPLALFNLDTFLLQSHPLVDKASIFRLAAGLCGGLQVLHRFLHFANGQEISILHGDFKPQNILVYKDKNGGLILKIADYGMSKIKPREQGQDHTTAAVKYGTFVSPEAYAGKKITIVSDLWGLGAVLLETVTYIVGGSHFVEEFRKWRNINDAQQGYSHDQFFIAKEEKARVNPDVNPGVTSWCQRLHDIALEQDETFGAVILKVLAFLEENLLVINVDQRGKTQAEDVRKVLLNAADALESHTTEGIVPPVTPKPMKFHHRVKMKLKGLFRRMFSKQRISS